MPVNSKRKGGTEENIRAKEVGQWIFNDKYAIGRHLTSGAIKTVYVGDLVPAKLLEWRKFPFIFEIKTGYPDFTPTFYNYKIIEEWYRLCRSDGKLTEQNIIIMICRFKNKKAFFITDQKLPFTHIIFNVAIPIKFTDHFEIAYVYYWHEIQELNFYELFNEVNINGETLLIKDVIMSKGD